VITDANPLGEAASRGSRLLLQKALEAKVAGFLSPERRRRTVSILCAYAIGWDGTKVLLHLTAGDRESRVCWGAFLDDIERRGLGGPLLVVVDGNTGVRKSGANGPRALCSAARSTSCPRTGGPTCWVSCRTGRGQHSGT